MDLPGYGYAKVAEKIKRAGQQAMEEYLYERHSLRGLVLVMDVRHPLTEFDRQMLRWCAAAELPVHVLLTKADKLKRGPANASLLSVRPQLAQLHPQATVQLFSALNNTGVDQASEVIAAWLSRACDGAAAE